MYNIFSKLFTNKIIYLLLVILLSIPAVKAIWWPGYYPMHDDLQFTRQIVMDECFKEGQIPCRWTQLMGYGYGYPIFNFYPPMPYYLGQVFRELGASYIDAIKVTFTLGFFVSAVGMYLLAAHFLGPLGGILSAVFYVYAPYHSTDIYVRGAMNEFWAIAWYPWVLWAITRLASKLSLQNCVILSVTISMLMLSHNPMLMIFFPIALLWGGFSLYRNPSFALIKGYMFSGILALALSLFFTLPVLAEQKFVHIETLVIGYFNYLAHYTDLNQLFLTMNWGYGESVHGPNDTMSFHIGYLHWILWFLVTLLSFVTLPKTRNKTKSPHFIIIVFSLLTLFYAFLTHSKSTELWKLFKPLEFLQFPWRLLSVIILGASFISGAILLFFKNSKIILVVSLFLVITTNVQYFRWRDTWPWVDDQHKSEGELWRLQTTAGIFDYLPIWAPLPPAGPPAGDGQVLIGEATTFTNFKNNIRQEFIVDVFSQTATWQLNTFYFPGWKYKLNDQIIDIDPNLDLDKEVGRPIFELKKGRNILLATFEDTPVRRFGNQVSLVAWIAILVYSLYEATQLFVNRRANN